MKCKGCWSHRCCEASDLSREPFQPKQWFNSICTVPVNGVDCFSWRHYVCRGHVDDRGGYVMMEHLLLVMNIALHIDNLVHLAL